MIQWEQNNHEQMNMKLNQEKRCDIVVEHVTVDLDLYESPRFSVLPQTVQVPVFL